MTLLLLLDAAGAAPALPPSAPWWAGLVAVALTSAAGIILALIQRREGGNKAVLKAIAGLRADLQIIKADQAKLAARLAEVEDDGTDPDVRAGRWQRVDERLDGLEEWRTKAERRAEETARIDAEIQRALGRVEGALGRVEGAMGHADRR